MSESITDVLDVVFVAPGDRGGAAQYPAHLVNALSEHAECRVSVIDVHATQTEFERLVTGVDVHEFADTDGGYVATVRNAFRAIKEIRRLDPDVVHVPFYTASIWREYILPMIWLSGIPVVVTLHDPISHQGAATNGQNRDVDAIKRMVGSYFIDKVIVHGESTREQAISAGYDAEKIETIPHGLYEHFRSQNEVDIQKKENQLLFFGNIRKNKGYDRIPELISQVRTEVPDAHAVVAGSFPGYTSDDSWETNLLRELEDHEAVTVDNRYIPEDEVERYFRESAVVVLPYYNATSSGVLMTAYTFDTPVVVTDTGDLGQYVTSDDSGLVATENSIDEISSAISNLLCDDRLREQKVENIRRKKTKYSWRCIAQQTFEIYDSM